MNWLPAGFFAEHALPLIKPVLAVPQKAKSKSEQANGAVNSGIAVIIGKKKISV